MDVALRRRSGGHSAVLDKHLPEADRSQGTSGTTSVLVVSLILTALVTERDSAAGFADEARPFAVLSILTAARTQYGQIRNNTRDASRRILVR